MTTRAMKERTTRLAQAVRYTNVKMDITATLVDSGLSRSEQIALLADMLHTRAQRAVPSVGFRFERKKVRIIDDENR